MKRSLFNFRTYVFRGILALIPLVLTLLTIRFIYIFIDKRITGILEDYIGYRIPGLGIIVLLIVLYFTGLVASNVIGKKFFGLLENISNRIPLVKTTYQVGKQLSDTFSLQDKQAFKKTVLVSCFKEKAMTVGFLTGHIDDPKSKERLLKVFVPTTPNPTSGFLMIVREKDVLDPQWTVEEGVQMIISGGLIGPSAIDQTS